MKAPRTIITPAITTDFAATADPLVFVKQILPERSIVTPDGQRLTFDQQYFTDCIAAFHAGKPQQTAFQLATPLNGHGHDMDPEKQRAIVTEMRTAEGDEPPGLYAKFKFFSKKAARAVRQNPDLGVSARLRENSVDHDGKLVKRSVVHILGTLDPVIGGMSPWRAVDLSAETGDVLDLSNSEYEGATVAKDKTTGGNTAVLDRPLTVAEIVAAINALSDEELAQLEADTDIDDETTDDADLEDDEDDEDDLEDDDDNTDDVVADVVTETTSESDDNTDGDTVTSLSVADRRTIDMARAETREANRKATDALRRAAAAEWDRERAEYLGEGVPPSVLDLAMPLLNRPEPFIVDLSNEDGAGAELNVAAIVRGILDEFKGTIDLSREAGHSGDGDDDDETSAFLAQWETESPNKMH